MSIQALPSAAVRLIGASQVITDAASLLKELIDNALDARATSITIDISSDTLSTLQLRDNGHGVAPEDRDLLCKRYCTSKIREYGDLKDIGGSSLGFRGEALASACEISGEMIVTTRVEGEEVASCLKMSPKGEIKSRTRASHPVGTTVKVTELFKALPVRKQTAVKSAAKTLARVKSMLQAYALARPNVRFALKVLKAKNDKGNWTYVPAKGQPKEDAAFKVVGKECAGQCEWQVMELHGFEVQAFLPRPDAVAGKISNTGHFVSIDGRPVSTTRGTLKQIVTLFRERLRGCSKNLEGVKDPFLWLNLVCPPGSYDPNIEPAKDDVVFEDSDLVIEAVGALLSSYYVPEAKEEVVEEVEATSPGAVQVYEDDEFEERPAKRPRTANSVKHNMYGGDDEAIAMLNDESMPLASIEDDENSQEDINAISVSNPFVMAKMNASNKPKRTTSFRNGQLMTPLHERNEVEDNSTSVGQSTDIPPHPPWGMPTPAASSPVNKRPATAGREESPLPFQRLTRRLYDDEEEEEDEETSLFLPENNPRDQPSSSRWRGWDKTADFTTAAQLPPGTQPQLPPVVPNAFQLLTPQTTTRPPRKRQQNKPRQDNNDYDTATPQAEDEGRVWFDHLQQASSGSSPAAKGRNGRAAGRKQQPDIDIRDMFAASAGIVAPTRMHVDSGALREADHAAPVDPISNVNTYRHGIPRAAANSRSGINAPFRPVIPAWRRTDAHLREDSILGDSIPFITHEQDPADHNEILNQASPLLDNQTADSSATFNDQTSVPFPSSIANLSTPRRLAACLDCHNTTSPSHTHNHTLAHPNASDAPHNLHPPPTRSKSSGLSRTRTAAFAKLPLERTPNGFVLQDLQTTLRGTKFDTIAVETRHLQDMHRSMPLEYGTPVWGVMEAIRAGDIEIYEDDAVSPSQEGQAEYPPSSQIPTMTQMSAQDSSQAKSPTVNLDVQAQSAFLAPPVSEVEANRWEEWVGAWIASSFRTPSGDEVHDADDEGDGEAELYVVDAVRDCARSVA